MTAFVGPLIGTDYETEHALINTNQVYFVIDGLALPLTQDAIENDLDGEYYESER